MLPQLTPATGQGVARVAAYAAREGVDVATFLESLGPVLSPEQAGQAIIELATGPGRARDGYLLTSAGLSPLQ